MKYLKKAFFLSAMLSFNGFAVDIVSGLNKDGASSRTFVQNNQIVIASCEKFSLHEESKPCKEKSRLEIPSREDFMQQGLYQLVLKGSKDEETQLQISKVRKIMDQQQIAADLKNAQDDLTKAMAEEEKILKFGLQTGQDVKQGSEYRKIQDEKERVTKRVDELSKKSETNLQGFEALEELKTKLAQAYLLIAKPKIFIEKDQASFNAEVIALIQKNGIKDLSSMNMFRRAEDLTIDEILSQKCVKDEDGDYTLPGRFGFISIYRERRLYVGKTENDIFPSVPGSRAMDFGSSKALKEFLLKHSSACHDINELPLVTGVLPLSELRQVEAVDESIASSGRDIVKEVSSLKPHDVKSFGSSLQ